MATNQSMRQGIYEGIIYTMLRASETLDACDVVELDPDNEGYVQACRTSGVPFGFVAEQVTASGVADYEPGGLVSHTAAVGDYVGVYICGGVYNHKDATEAPWGAEVYAGSTTAGKVTTGASSNGTKVGVVVSAKDASTGICKIKSYL